MILSSQIAVSTQGDGHTSILQARCRDWFKKALHAGAVVLFVIGSTAGLTPVEYEPGAVADLGRVFEKIGPQDAEYEHHVRRHDDNAITTTWTDLVGGAGSRCRPLSAWLP